MVHNNPGSPDATLRSGIHPPGTDHRSNLDDGSPLHPALDMVVVLVNWVDSHGGHENWDYLEDCKFIPPADVWTVGFLTNEDDTCIEVTGCISKCGDGEQRMYSMTIPKACIKYRRDTLWKKLDI